jgi:hypothetical protein
MKLPALNRRILVLIVAGLALAACGKKSEEQVADTAAKGAAPAAPAEPAAAPVKPAVEEELKRYATAVENGKSSAPVELKYDVPAKPEVGQPFEVELAFVPRIQADTIEVEVTGMQDLVIDGDGRIRFDAVEAGEAYKAKLQVRADAPGLYYLGVSARVITPVQTEARAFSVPLVVGEVAAQEKPAPEVDATGQSVQSMPAAEQVQEKK